MYIILLDAHTEGFFLFLECALCLLEELGFLNKTKYLKYRVPSFLNPKIFLAIRAGLCCLE